MLFSCSQPGKPIKTDTYFDLAGYFSREAERLSRLNPDILKTVSRNGEQEQKKLRVTNWKNELELFELSDINKPAWRDSYSVKQSGSSVSYLSNDPKLRTREIKIDFDDAKKVKHILIVNKSDNALYTSDETLNYFPDSAYSIDKRQHVVLIGNNDYLVQGKLKF
ncbi:hypothetical protein GS399_10260 [Pedobacter sp. HMF7647]|uniref:Uncharacterized protein n=1 Tax=Hufsiella arboris TaxID=2695275 RepID=A0A7K1Y9V4_9SPHI|nr:hypothetical protein [Hufsiella arboris]